VNDFWVLLGPDYAGKSSVMRALAGRLGPSWRMVSYDDEFVPHNRSIIRHLRRDFLGEVLRHTDRYSPDFLLTILQASIVYLRDRTLEVLPRCSVLVDSYYYKVLAKCTLAGYVNDALFAWWRTFPPPRGIVYLDVDPATAWQRSGAGATLNPLEHYGGRPTWPAFRRYQLDLRRELLCELGGLPVTTIDATRDIAEVCAAAEAVLTNAKRRERDERAG
jgi:thymidylate kinase